MICLASEIPAVIRGSLKNRTKLAQIAKGLGRVYSCRHAQQPAVWKASSSSKTCYQQSSSIRNTKWNRRRSRQWILINQCLVCPFVPWNVRPVEYYSRRVWNLVPEISHTGRFSIVELPAPCNPRRMATRCCAVDFHVHETPLWSVPRNIPHHFLPWLNMDLSRNHCSKRLVTFWFRISSVYAVHHWTVPRGSQTKIVG